MNYQYKFIYNQCQYELSCAMTSQTTLVFQLKDVSRNEEYRLTISDNDVKRYEIISFLGFQQFLKLSKEACYNNGLYVYETGHRNYKKV